MATTIITVATTTTSSRIEEGSIEEEEEEEEEGGVSEEDLLEGTRAGMLHLHRRGYQVGSYATTTYGLLCYVCNKLFHLSFYLYISDVFHLSFYPSIYPTFIHPLQVT